MLERLDESVKVFKRMLVETLDNHYYSGLYMLKYHLLNHMVEDLQKFDTLSVLDSSPYERFNVYNKQEYRSTSQKKTKSDDGNREFLAEWTRKGSFF